MRPYAEVARRTFQRYATYRAAAVAGVFTNTVFGFLRVYVLLAVFRHRSSVGSFDVVDVVTFTFVSEGFLAVVGAFTDTGLGMRIRTGDVVSDLYRPLHFAGYWLAEDLGRAGFQILARGVPPVLLGALAFELRLPADGAIWLAFVTSLLLAILVSFSFRFAVTLSSFWLVDIFGPWQIAGFTMAFLSGFLLPVTFFPDWLARVAALTPFPSIVQLPIEVFLGKHAGAGATLAVLAQQALWAVGLFALCEVVVARAVRRVVVQGG
jgi:ABC-2 type transport system permease protein